MDSDSTRKIRLIMRLRNAGIHDTSVLAAMERVPREIFVPEELQDQANNQQYWTDCCGNAGIILLTVLTYDIKPVLHCHAGFQFHSTARSSYEDNRLCGAFIRREYGAVSF